ncbi:hypothetical protein F5141DRAFT_1067672 [Pisolithus sp. B1]|nr:hypothetical protein F5141DRAFT_1067672 [Pisolithus sp. B1]
MAVNTLAAICTACSRCSPVDYTSFLKAVKWLWLNGVVKPVWKLWPLLDPSEFITPEVLHHFHQMFWDHDIKWCIAVTGAVELDFHFSIIQPLVGYQAFKEGISKLKQVMGHDHHAVQCYIIATVAGSIPCKFLIAIHAFLNFCYLTQVPSFTTQSINRVASALQEFHNHKESIQMNEGGDSSESDKDEEHEPDTEKTHLSGYSTLTCPLIDYFTISASLLGAEPSVQKPYHTFATSTTGFHLATKPSLQLTVDEAASMYQLPDLKSAMAAFFTSQEHKLQIWHKVCVQQLQWLKKVSQCWVILERSCIGSLKVLGLGITMLPKSCDLVVMKISVIHVIYSNYHGSLQNSAGIQANAVYPTRAWGALSLLSTGKAEYVKEVNLILQDMKIELIPSQPMQCYPQKAGIKVEVEQSAPLQSKHYMRAGQTAPQMVLHMAAKVSLGYEWPQEISRVRWKEIICTLPPQ